MGKPDASARAAIGGDLAAVLPSGPWHKKTHLIKLNFVVASLVLFCMSALFKSFKSRVLTRSASANGYDGSLMNGLQALKQWNNEFNHPTGAFLGFINAIYWIGAGLMSPVAAVIANKYGRKMPIWVGYAFLALGAGLQTGANNEGAFAVARFFVGNASACFSTSIPLLINEIAYPSHRGTCGALYNCGWVCVLSIYLRGVIDSWLVRRWAYRRFFHVRHA